MARKSSKKAKKTEPVAQDSVQQVVQDFENSWDYTSSNYHKRWEDAFSLYNNRRVNKGYNGITDTFVPMTFSTIETMVAALFGSKPKFQFEPPHDQPDQNTEILNSLLNYYWDKDKWSVKVVKWGRGMLREGTSVVYLFWNIDRPCMINVPIRDFFIDPTATDPHNARYMGRRYLTTLEELESFEVIDMDNPDENGEYTNLKKKYKNLNKVQEGFDTGEQTDKEKKDIFYGSTVKDAEKHQVEVIEYWTEDRVISIANRSVEIENSENYFKSKQRENGVDYPKGLMPFAVLRNYTDESLFFAKGEVDVIAEQQELLNDITNQNIDSVTFTLNQMYALHPDYAHLLEEIENIPGATYLVDPNALKPIDQRPIPGDAFNERLNLKNEIRETTASNEIVKGASQDQQATATEIQAQIAGSGQRLSLKIVQIEDEGFHDLARLVFEMVKCYVTEPMMIKIVGKDGVRWELFDPLEFKGEYEPRVQLEAGLENKKNQLANMTKEMLAAFLNDPDINQPELKKMVLAKAFELEPDEVDALVQPNPETPQIDAGGEPLPGEEPATPELPEMAPEDEMALLDQAEAELTNGA